MSGYKLEIVPKHLFSWDYKVLQGAAPVATIALSLWREKGEIAVAGQTCRIFREGWLSGSFILEANGKVLAWAEKPSAFTRTFTVHYQQRQLTLQAPSLFSRRMVLLEDAREVGALKPLGIFSRRAEVDFPVYLPLPVRVFMIALVIFLWKRAAHSNSSQS